MATQFLNGHIVLPWVRTSPSTMQSSCVLVSHLLGYACSFFMSIFSFPGSSFFRTLKHKPHSLSFPWACMYAAARISTLSPQVKTENPVTQENLWLLDHKVNVSSPTFWWAFNFELDVDIHLSDDRITPTSSLHLLPFLEGSCILFSLKNNFSFHTGPACQLSLVRPWLPGQGLSPSPQDPFPVQPRTGPLRLVGGTQVVSTLPSSAVIFLSLEWKRRHSSSSTRNVWKRRFCIWILNFPQMKLRSFIARSSPSSLSGRDLR